MYIDEDGNKYESYKDYANSPDLDLEDIQIIMLPANLVNDAYLNDGKIKILA